MIDKYRVVNSKGYVMIKARTELIAKNWLEWYKEEYPEQRFKLEKE